jgi:hypothetical protein
MSGLMGVSASPEIPPSMRSLGGSRLWTPAQRRSTRMGGVISQGNDTREKLVAVEVGYDGQGRGRMLQGWIAVVQGLFRCT